MEWNELPELQHPTVKLGAQLEVYYPDWSNPIKIPNRISRIDLKQLLDIKTEEINVLQLGYPGDQEEISEVMLISSIYIDNKAI